jgi:hypothetical protein
MARTAVVAGTATSVSNRVSRRQAQRWSERDAPAPQEQYVRAPAPSAEDSRITQLQQLAELKGRGVLTDEEFAAEKARILG